MDQFSGLQQILAVVIGLPIGLALGALMLQAAAALCGYEDVSFGRGVLATFVLTVVNVLIYLVVVYSISYLGLLKAASQAERQILTGFICLPLQTLAAGALLRPVLHIPFKWGMLVFLLQQFVAFVVLAVLFLLLLGTGLFSELLGWRWV